MPSMLHLLPHHCVPLLANTICLVLFRWSILDLRCFPHSTQAVTVYSLYSADMEMVHLRLRALFRNSIRLPLSPFSDARCEAFADVGYRGEGGEVEIEVVHGPRRSGPGH